MALVAYDIKRKTNDIALDTEYETVDSTKERKTCETLIRTGLFGPDLAFSFQLAWRRYLRVITGQAMFIWRMLVGFLKRFW